MSHGQELICNSKGEMPDSIIGYYLIRKFAD